MINLSYFCNLFSVIMQNSKGDHGPVSPTESAVGTVITLSGSKTNLKKEKSHIQGEDNESDVIGDLMGRFGKWQLIMTLLLSLFQVPNTFHIISPVYQVNFYRYK